MRRLIPIWQHCVPDPKGAESESVRNEFAILPDIKRETIIFAARFRGFMDNGKTFLVA